LHGKAGSAEDEGKPEDRPIAMHFAMPGVWHCRLAVRRFQRSESRRRPLRAALAPRGARVRLLHGKHGRLVSMRALRALLIDLD
jgi:hypothetical protein